MKALVNSTPGDFEHICGEMGFLDFWKAELVQESTSRML